MKVERKLTFSRGSHSAVGTARIFDLDAEDEGRWKCRWSIDHISPEIGRMQGRDSVEAVLRCFEIIRNLISGSEEDGWEIWWQFRGDHGGFG